MTKYKTPDFHKPVHHPFGVRSFNHRKYNVNELWFLNNGFIEHLIKINFFIDINAAETFNVSVSELNIFYVGVWSTDKTPC